jgi:hypothetical protein
MADVVCILWTFGLFTYIQPFGIFNGHLVHYVVLWYIFSRFGLLYQENLATLPYNNSKPLCTFATTDIQ